MNVLVITTDKALSPKYTIHGPMSVEEAIALTREASLVIALVDSMTAKANQGQIERLYSCVANSPLACRKEKQVKTMEYVVGSLLSELVSINSFPEPTRIQHQSFPAEELKRLFHKIPEPLAVAHISDLGEIFYRTHKKNIQLTQFTGLEAAMTDKRWILSDEKNN